MSVIHYIKQIFLWYTWWPVVLSDDGIVTSEINGVEGEENRNHSRLGSGLHWTWAAKVGGVYDSPRSHCGWSELPGA